MRVCSGEKALERIPFCCLLPLNHFRCPSLMNFGLSCLSLSYSAGFLYIHVERKKRDIFMSSIEAACMEMQVREYEREKEGES